ncbi:hypothetical protein E4633_16740 [Geomonas terrae]|uniref:Lipoprotein n=1 Tax=Geomonas terrae TaxID=2562681 RepID=A0A4S1CCB5_9BACT|nr:hypothetical protein [Geomonas terrae]TGU70650.1 hypothetical protein E4633_16740 [Geomonas terrae]
MFKRFALLFCNACLVAVLSSCGAGDLGGGVGEFTTVNATATALTSRLESDIVKGNNCSDSVSTGGTVVTDSVNVAFASKALYTTGALDLVISKITIHYTPVNSATTPPIPDSYVNISQTVVPGDTPTIPVAVLTDAQKIALMERTTLPMTLCSSSVFEYWVDIVFDVSEVGGKGETHPVTAKMNLAVADRI